MSAERWRRLLPGLWAGALLCVALLATPSAFATLLPFDAGRTVGRMLAQEAYTSLALGLVLLVLERAAARRAGGAQFSTGMALAFVTLFCTVAGYFAVQPMMAAARAGHGSLSFGHLHAVSSAFFVVKGCAVLALAWRASSNATSLRAQP